MVYFLFVLDHPKNDIRPLECILGNSEGLLATNDQLAVGQPVRFSEKAMEALRLRGSRVGNLITVRDRLGKDFRARIVAMHPDHCEALVFEAFSAPAESPVNIHLLQALPKKETLEWIIQKVTELGVNSVVPFESEKSITLAERDATQKKSHRWQHIAIKAAQQCRQARVPHVHPVLAFCDAIELFDGSDLRLLLWEREPSQTLRTILARANGPIDTIILVVGPEGGFSPRELEIAGQKGYISTGLGRRILRTETAAIAATAILQYELGDLGGKTERGQFLSSF